MDSFLENVNILESYLRTVILLGLVVVSWNSFLVQSFGAGIAIGFHELPGSQKDT